MTRIDWIFFINKTVNPKNGKLYTAWHTLKIRWDFVGLFHLEPKGLSSIQFPSNCYVNWFELIFNILLSAGTSLNKLLVWLKCQIGAETEHPTRNPPPPPFPRCQARVQVLWGSNLQIRRRFPPKNSSQTAGWPFEKQLWRFTRADERVIAQAQRAISDQMRSGHRPSFQTITFPLCPLSPNFAAELASDLSNHQPIYFGLLTHFLLGYFWIGCVLLTCRSLGCNLYVWDLWSIAFCHDCFCLIPWKSVITYDKTDSVDNFEARQEFQFPII